MFHLFKLAQLYKPLSVGIEINGQQGGFISWIKSEMIAKNIWFNLAASKGSSGGIRRSKDKLENFNYIVPLFKERKIHFPLENQDDEIMRIFQEQISLALKSGFKGKDDFLDTISMLSYIEAVRPSASLPISRTSDGVWHVERIVEDSPLESYIV